MNEQPTNPDEYAARQFDADAAMAAERVLSDSNSEYLEHHPNAIQNPAKAKHVAYAAKRLEERVIGHTNSALLSQTKIDTETSTANKSELRKLYVEPHIERAQQLRARADQVAEEASTEYDTLQGLKT